MLRKEQKPKDTVGKKYKNTWKWFFQNNSIGGLDHVTNADNIVSRVFWLILFLAGAGLTTYSTYNTIMNFFKYNTLTSVTMENHPLLQFPAVTICNSNRIHCGNLYALITNTTAVSIT